MHLEASDRAAPLAALDRKESPTYSYPSNILVPGNVYKMTLRELALTSDQTIYSISNLNTHNVKDDKYLQRHLGEAVLKQHRDTLSGNKTPELTQLKKTLRDLKRKRPRVKCWEEKSTTGERTIFVQVGNLVFVPEGTRPRDEELLSQIFVRKYTTKISWGQLK